MIKKRIAAKAAILSSATGLMTAGIFYGLSHHTTMAPSPNSIGTPRLIASLQPLKPNQSNAEAKTIRLWSKVYFPTDDHDGQELGRKIGDWVVKKIKN